MMKNKKAAVLPGAVMLLLLLTIISLAVVTVTMTMTANRMRNVIRRNDAYAYSQIHAYFVENNGDLTGISGFEEYEMAVYELSETAIKALTISKNETMKFYSIYDFGSHKLLAYQTSSFYITEAENVSYLGGLVPMTNGE